MFRFSDDIKKLACTRHVHCSSPRRLASHTVCFIIDRPELFVFLCRNNIPRFLIGLSFIIIDDTWCDVTGFRLLLKLGQVTASKSVSAERKHWTIVCSFQGPEMAGRNEVTLNRNLQVKWRRDLCTNGKILKSQKEKTAKDISVLDAAPQKMSFQ